MCDFTARLAGLLRESADDLATAITRHGAGSIDAQRVLHECLVAAEIDERLSATDDERAWRDEINWRRMEDFLEERAEIERLYGEAD